MKFIVSHFLQLRVRQQLCIVLVLFWSSASMLPGQTLTTLHRFEFTDGANPKSAVVQSLNGELYGTTGQGGSNGRGGTIWRIAKNGTFAALYSFCAQPNCTDGEGPESALVQASNGDLYGTTAFGGEPFGDGAIFKISPSGQFFTIYSFSGVDGDSSPYGALVQAPSGYFYGTADSGGVNGGIVFNVTPSGTLTTIAVPNPAADGAQLTGITPGSNGEFYGTATTRGIGNAGTVFKVTPNGEFTVLYSFCSQDDPACTNGSEPVASPVQGEDSNFYGSTSGGGIYGAGTIYKITPNGSLTSIYSFCAVGGVPSCFDGEFSNALIQATDGNFYGTTVLGGAHGHGTIFKITPSGMLTTLYSFCSQAGCSDGVQPGAGVMQATNGDFYGTTAGGGSFQGCRPGCGTVFRFSMGLGPFVKFQTTLGKVGSTVEILGTDLTGTTSVTFNGKESVFTILSNSAISATVPAGAITGLVQVVTPTGTLSSNAAFQVLL